MTQGPHHRWRGAEAADAADWVVRLRAPDAGEADWLAFEQWLDAASGNRARFDQAEAVWAMIDRHAEDIAAALEDAPAAKSVRAPATRWFASFGAIAAVVVLALALPYGAGLFAVHPVTFATVKGERRTLQLADGTRVDLNTGSTISVRMDRGHREVVMNDAEAAFDVTHDPSRPFIIHVGDETVRVVGTQFDVSHRDGLISVTVRRGLVRVMSQDGSAVSLTPGERLRSHEGAGDVTVDAVAADDAFAWRQGRIICRDETLEAVVANLNRYFPRTIRLGDGQLASLRFSGVLTVDDESSTLQRLSALLPLSATPSEGVILLRSRDPAR